MRSFFLAVSLVAMAAAVAEAQHAHSGPDSILQARGRLFMGVDQYTSSHVFDDLPGGGRIELQRDVEDSVGTAVIRAHLQGITTAFASGDFTTPGLVHLKTVPGIAVMTARRASITWTYRALPRGGEVLIRTSDPSALRAIHQFLAFQRNEHHAKGNAMKTHTH